MKLSHNFEDAGKTLQSLARFTRVMGPLAWGMFIDIPQQKKQNERTQSFNNGAFIKMSAQIAGIYDIKLELSGEPIEQEQPTLFTANHLVLPDFILSTVLLRLRIYSIDLMYSRNMIHL